MRTKKLVCTLLVFIMSLFCYTPLNLKAMQEDLSLHWVSSGGGLYGGVITAFVQNPINSDIYASTIRGHGVYKYMHEQQQWEPFGEGLGNKRVHSLLFTQDMLFAGTEDFVFKWDSLQQQWMKMNEEMKQVTAKTMIAFDYLQPLTGEKHHIILAGTNQGIYRTQDQGLTWENINIAGKTYDISDFANTKNENGLVIATAAGRWLLRSNDAGKNWNIVNEKAGTTEIKSIWVDNENSSRWVAGTYQQGIMISNDSGFTWAHHNEQLNNMYISQIKQNERTNEYWISTYDGIYYTAHQDIKWQLFQPLPFNDQVNAFIIDIYNQIIMVGTQGDGAYWSKKNQPLWNSIKRGMDNTYIRTMISTATGRYIFAGTWGSGIFRSSDKGLTWTRVNQGITNPFILSLAYNDRGDILAGTFNGGLFLSSNSGESWQQITAPTLFSKYIYSIAYDPQDSNRIYVGTEEGIFRSVSNGESWSNIGPGTRDQPTGEITTIEINPGNPKIIFVGTRSSGVYISQNGGDSWIPSNEGVTNKHITKIIIHPRHSNFILLSTFGSGVFQSKDGGASWEAINQGLNNLKVYDITLELHQPQIYYAATDVGIYQFHEENENWKIYGEGLEREPIRSIMIETQQNILLAGSYGNGIYALQYLPNAPDLQQPAHQAKIIDQEPNLQWGKLNIDSPLTYALQVSSDQHFNQIIFDRTNITGTIIKIPQGYLNRHQRYYWRVRAEIKGDTGKWSKIYYFDIVTMMILKINDPLITINGKEQEIDPGRGTVPIIRSQRTFLPIRVIIESVDGEIEWHPDAQSVKIMVNSKIIWLTIGKTIAIVDEKEIQIDPNETSVAPFILNGRTMLPLRFIAENIFMEVQWEGATQTITLIYPSAIE